MSVADGLLDAIYANPDDDAPRLVYMDYLLQRGDPHGELIALQMRAQLTDEERARMKRLAVQHGESLVPPAVLRRVERNTMRFERGFLARCRLRKADKPVGSPIAGHPAWRTVHAIHAQGPGFGANRVLLAPELHALRRLQIDHGLFVRDYLLDPAPKALEVLAFSWLYPGGRERDVIEQLGAATGLGNLKHLIIYVRTNDALEALMQTALVGRLDRLSLHSRTLWEQIHPDLRERARAVDFDAWNSRRALFD